MENTDNIIKNKEDERKNKCLEARRRAARAFHTHRWFKRL